MACWNTPTTDVDRNQLRHRYLRRSRDCTCGDRAWSKWRAPRSARVGTLKKCLTAPALSEPPGYITSFGVARDAPGILFCQAFELHSAIAARPWLGTLNYLRTTRFRRYQ